MAVFFQSEKLEVDLLDPVQGLHASHFIFVFISLVKFLVRYSAVRKQFGPPGKGEIPVLEYQMQVCEALNVRTSELCKG